MRVHGLDGLRVVDASAMPYVTNGNIYAPVMMLAEKAADLIPATRRCRPSRSRSTATLAARPPRTALNRPLGRPAGSRQFEDGTFSGSVVD